MQNLFSSSTRITQNPAVIFRQLDSICGLLFYPDHHRFRELNETAILVWQLCEQGSDLEAIEASMLRTFEIQVANDLRSDLSAFVAEMVADGFLVSEEANGP